MKDAWSLLLGSRKFWVGTITVLAIACATALVAMGKVPSGQLVPTIAAITATGIAVIGTIAWEDTATFKANASVEAAESGSKGISNLVKPIVEEMSKSLRPPPPPPIAEESAPEVTKS